MRDTALYFPRWVGMSKGRNSIIVVTDSSIKAPDLFQPDGQIIINTNEALTLTELPNSMIIIGGGMVGCEFALIFSAFGVKISIIDIANQLIPNLDQITTTIYTHPTLCESFSEACNGIQDCQSIYKTL